MDRAASLLLLILSASVAYVATDTIVNKDSKKCQLVVRDSITVSGSVTSGGTTQSVSETFNENHGYRCRQATGSDPTLKKCNSTNVPAHTLPTTGVSSSDPVGGLVAFMCLPSAKSTVTRTRYITIGGSTVAVDFRWVNITDCGCRLAWIP